MDKIILRRVNILFCLLLMIVLSSCSTHVSRPDGPPNFYVDETKIPNAVPKVEPLAKYGNMKSYSVFGKRYYTLKSSRNFVQYGTASWYGTKFDARNTSSGERYNMLAMTAAHKTLPLPTYVEVTNTQNHRKIIVKVNDRGPFESNRIIDLSYVAAKKLGMLAHGTAHVRLKAINPYTYGQQFTLAKSLKRVSAPIEHFLSNSKKHMQIVYLQVGAFREKSHAEKLRKQLVAMFKAPVLISHPSTGKLYRVRIGPIRSATADKITYRLQHLGIKPNKLYGV